MAHTSAITSQLICAESKVCWKYVGVSGCACAPVNSWLFMWVPCYACIHCIHAYVYLCLCTQVHMTPSTWLELSLHALKNGIRTWQSNLVMHDKAWVSPGLRSRVTSSLLTTFDIFSFIYFQALMWWSECGWGGPLGAAGLALAHVIRPYMVWHLAWSCGAPSGSSELICSQPGMPDIWSQTC